MDTKEINISDIFAEDGLLASHLPGYEFRPSQGQMAQAVDKVLREERHLMVEADTGVGKTLSYLAPAIIWAVTNEKKVIISTNTINLQEQLIHKDLPLLKKMLPYRFQAVLVKGRRNYLCWRRLERIVDDETGKLISDEDMVSLEKLRKWA